MKEPYEEKGVQKINVKLNCICQRSKIANRTKKCIQRKLRRANFEIEQITYASVEKGEIEKKKSKNRQSKKQTNKSADRINSSIELNNACTNRKA